MPDQPADPIHYDMKIPPEPKHTHDEQKNRDPEHDGSNDEEVKRKEENAGEQSGS